MKKLLFFFTFITIVMFSFEQTNVYHPFPDSNAVWVEEFSYLDGVYCWKYDGYNLYISGDTTIGGNIYHKLYRNGCVSKSCTPPGISDPPYYYFGQYWGAFRQDNANKKVYLNDNGNDTLAYDFNLNVGDQLPQTFLYQGGIVDSIDSVFVGGQYNKRFWVSDPSLWIYASIIEGVANSFGVFSPITSYFECNSGFWCLQVNNETVYNVSPNYPCTVINEIEKGTIPNQITINPNPFSKISVIHINKNLSDATLKVYNALGQEMKCISNITGQEIIFQRDNLPIGVYFIRLTQKNAIIAISKIIIMN